jgi:CRISPR/Cas system-associated endonuclease Cas1
VALHPYGRGVSQLSLSVSRLESCRPERESWFQFQRKIMNLKGEGLDKIRAKLHGIEGRYTKRYFDQIFCLLPESIRPENRKGFKAYDGTNNIFNLAYEMLS